MKQREIAKKYNFLETQVQTAAIDLVSHKYYFGINEDYSEVEEHAIVVYIKTFNRTKNEKYAVTAAIEYLKEQEIIEEILKSMDISGKYGLLPQ